MNLPDRDQLPERSAAQIERFRDYRGRAVRWPLNVRVVVGDRSDEVAAAVRDHRPHVVHFKHHGASASPVLEDAAVFARFEPQVECIVLEDCFTADRADALGRATGVVVGINGPFVELFLSTFYARYTAGGPYYEFFCSAEWSFFNHYPETAAASLDQRPRVFTRSNTTFESGWAGGLAEPGGITIAGRFPRVLPVEQPLTYPLWYGTNRKPNDAQDPAQGYSGERDDIVHFGTCEVVVPKSHEIGSLGSPFWKRLFTRHDGPITLNQSSLRRFAEDEFWSRIAVDMSGRARAKRNALCFIHGFNVSFEAAALRTAQLAADLRVEGVAAFFSWPSKSVTAEYFADDASIDDSEEAIGNFLAHLVQKVGRRAVDVIAHSMGNKGLLRAMDRLMARAARRTGLTFGQIILAAPDVGRALFARLAPVYQKVSRRTTMYVSAKDKALASSGIIRDYARAGFTPPVTIVSGIDTIETSGIDLSFLGHGYFADARPVLQDMHELLQHDAPPDRRFGLTRQQSPDGVYWTVSA